MTALVSIIIRTYGERCEFLKEAVTSVINQTYPSIELIIIEDGSSVSSDYAESIKDKLHKVVYVSIEKGGRCVAGNKGLELAAGEFIGFLDDDDQLLPKHVETLVSVLIESGYMAVYSEALQVQTEVKSLSPLVYTEHSREVVYKQPFSRKKMWEGNYIPIQSIIFSRKLYEIWGGFDIELDYLEDWNLWLRYSLKHDFLYVPKATSFYRIPATEEVRSTRAKLIGTYGLLAIVKRDALIKQHIPSHIRITFELQQLIGACLILARKFISPYRFLLRSLFLRNP